MPIKIQCQACRKPMQAPDRLAGKRARCKCGALLTVPDAVAEVEPAELDLTAASDAGPRTVAVARPKANAASADSATVAAAPAVCPNCLADLPAGAVLCTACGFHLKSGRQLGVSTSEAPEDAAGPPSGRGRARSSKSNSGIKSLARISVTLSVVKWVLIVGVVVGAAWAVREAVLFDPHQQALDVTAKIYPGMTVQEVVDTVGDPPEETHVFDIKEKDFAGLKLPEIVDERIAYCDDFMNKADKTRLENGFYFVYWYSERDKLMIHFDSEGIVEQVELVESPFVSGLWGR